MNFGAGMRCFLENVASVSAAHLEHEGFRYVQEDWEMEKMEHRISLSWHLLISAIPFSIFLPNFISRDGAKRTEQPTVFYGNMYLFWVFLRVADEARNRIHARNRRSLQPLPLFIQNGSCSSCSSQSFHNENRSRKVWMMSGKSAVFFIISEKPREKNSWDLSPVNVTLRVKHY